MNNINKSLSINETYIIDSSEGNDIFSACTALYTNNIISCSGNTQIDLGENLIVFNGNTLATIISATTFYGDGSNLTGISTQDTFVTGGTYSNGTAVFTNNTGGTFTVTGFYTGGTSSFDVFVTGGTYSDGVAIFTNNTGGTFSVTGFSTNNATQFTGGTVTGTTFFSGGLSATTFSASTYLGLPIDVFVTGATKSNDVATFVNNTGGTFTLTGLTDTIFTGGTVIGPTYFINGLTANTISASTIYSDLGLNVNDNSGNQSNFNAGYFDIYPSGGGVITNFGAALLFVSNDTNGVSSSLEPTLLQLQTPQTLTQYTEYGIFTQSSASTINSFLYPTKPNNYVGTFAMLDDLTNVVNLVTVGLTGSTGVDYYSVKEAVDSITGASATNTYVVKVGPGVFYEDPITMKSYVDVIGESETNTIIQANNPNTSLIIGADQSMISDVQIQGCTGTSVAAVVYSSPTTPQLNAIFYVENVRFGANYTHAKTVGTGGGNCIMQCSNVKYGGYPFTLGFYVTNDGSGVGRMQLRNVTSTNGGVTTTSGLIFAKADQPNCAFIVNGCLLTKTSGAAAGTGFWVENGGSLRLTAVNFQRWETGIYAPQVGSAPSVEAIALNFENCTTDVNIIHSGATGKIQGTDNYLKTLINIDAPLYEVNEDPRIITVGKKGNNFKSIKSAVDAITASSSTNRYVVRVVPGIYVEDEIVLQGKEFISVVGEDILQVLVVAANPSQNIFTLGNNNELSFMTLSGASSGVALSCVDTGGFSLVHKISIYDCDTNVLIKAENADSTFYGEYMDFNGEYSYGTRVLALNGLTAYGNFENYYNYPTGVNPTIGNSVQGSGATLSVFVGDGIGNGVSGSTNYQIEDYGSLNTSSTTADNWDYGIRVLNNGGPSRFDIDSYSIVNSVTYDLSIEHPNTFGTFGGGSASHAKINNLSDSVSWAFLDIEDGEFDITRKISVTFQNGTHTDASTLIFEGSTMGLIDGGIITHVSGLTFQVSSGFGYLELTTANEVYSRLDWDDTQITLSPNSENYLYFNENNILSTSSNAPDNITNIILGRVVTDGTSVRFIDVTPYNSSHTSNLLSTFNRNALGPIYSNGSFVTENVTPYHLNISAGDYYFSENNFLPSGGTNVTFTQYYRDGSTGWITTGTTEVVNGYDDNSGTISPLPLSAFTKHTLYVVGEGANEKYMLVLGQTYYTTLIEAEGADLPTPPTYFDDGVTTIASIYIQQGVSGITQIQDIRPVIGFKAAGVSATAVHGNLLGLNADDHTQYLLVDGVRAMTGNLSMGGNAIVSGLTYNGVTIESHASRHKNGGADEIASATPAPSEIPKADTFGKLDGWISDASTTVKGLTRLSQAPASATVPIAVGVNDLRFLNSITAVTNTTPSLVFTNNSGGTTTISNIRFSSVTATTISATTYQNLPTDIRVTGGTYNSGAGQLTFRNNTGGTFNVGGFFRPSDDIYVTGGTVGHEPSNGANKLDLNRSDNNTINIYDLVNISDTNRNEILSVIAERNIIRGKTYKIDNCDDSLYNNGTDIDANTIYTTVYLMGLESNKLSETGIGVFYTPKYSDYGIFNPEATYVLNDKVIWGGYMWVNKGLGNGSSLNIFDLDTVYWTKILPFENGELETRYYVVRYDDIIYDINNNRIVYRNEENTNIVSTTVDNIDYWVSDMSLYNPIRVFQWGNVYNKGAGIGNQQIINSYNENINYRGQYQKDFYFEGLSYQKNVFAAVGESYQTNFYFKDGSYQSDVNVLGTSYQSSLYLTNISYLSNIDITDGSYQDGVYLDNESYMNNILINNGSWQKQISLNNKSYFTNIDVNNKNSYQENLYFNNDSYQSNISFGDGCGQLNFNFDNNSYQNNITLLNSSNVAQQISFNFTNVSRQANITIDGSKQQVFNFNYGYQNNITTTTGQSYITIENGIQFNNFDVAQTNITIKGYELNWAVYPSVISPQDNLFFIHDLPSEKTSKLVGKIENRLVEVNDLYYDGTKWVIDGAVSASNYLGLPLDIRVTGGTYNSGTGVITFRNNTGGTFTVSGITSGGNTFTGGTVSGATNFTNGLTANTFSATTYQNLPTDIRVTGGTYNSGTAQFTNNTGGTFTVTGFSTGFGSNPGLENWANIIGGTLNNGDTVIFDTLVRSYGTSLLTNDGQIWTNSTSNTLSFNISTSIEWSNITGADLEFIKTVGINHSTLGLVESDSVGTNNQFGITEPFSNSVSSNIVLEPGESFSVVVYIKDNGTPASSYYGNARLDIASLFVGEQGPQGPAGPSFTGGTVSGATNFTNGISAVTYNGYTPLPTQAASSTGVVLSFVTDTVYGTLATPETGTTISADTTNGQLGVTNIVIHSGGTAPTFSSEYKKLSGSGNYSTGQINYIFATYITSTEIIYAINQRT